MKKKVWIHIYCGDGKGKTTAAVGLMIRAAGNGKKILFAQFLKDNQSSELKILKKIPEVSIIPAPDQIPFIFQMTEKEKNELKIEYEAKLKDIFSQVLFYNVLVLDEIIYAISAGVLSEDQLIREIKNIKKDTEIVLTGQMPSKTLKDMADYVSEIKKIKHPFDFGFSARPGIEF